VQTGALPIAQQPESVPDPCGWRINNFMQTGPE
jgi:hypothetical protein